MPMETKKPDSLQHGNQQQAMHHLSLNQTGHVFIITSQEPMKLTFRTSQNHFNRI